MSKKDVSSIRILGSGLIGTSIGLALAGRGTSVEMVDSDLKASELAQSLVNSKPSSSPEVVLFALPTSALSAVLNIEYELNPKARFIDIGSVKTKPLLEVSKSKIPSNRFLATHPMAGREVGGAESARADLFEARTWVYSKKDLLGHEVDPEVLEAGLWIIESLGAKAVSMDPKDHDAAVALVSHLPQLISSLLAAQLNEANEQTLSLAGPGLIDTTRIAASDADLWSEIAAMNGSEILPLLEKFSANLSDLMNSLRSELSIKRFIADGNTGRARIPGKHGAKARNYSQLPVVIVDKPGQLASLFEECSKANVNIEDLSIEHSPGQFTGLITLALSASDAQKLESHLKGAGWNVHAPR